VPLATYKNGALDVIDTLKNLSAEFNTGIITAAKFQAAAKALSIRGERGVVPDVATLERMVTALHSGAVTGEAQGGANKVLSSTNEQLGIAQKNWQALEIVIGMQMLPALTKIAQVLSPIVQGMTAWASTHETFVKYGLIIKAISAAVLVIGGAIALLVADALAIGSVIAPIAGAVAGFVTLGDVIAAAVVALIAF
jgi:TP901 family phage tail tape measure protein